jgi:tetratricopeptide (TPR) repeat protein
MVMATRRLKRLTAALLAVALAATVAGCQSDEEKLAAFMRRGDEYRDAQQHDEAIIEYRNALQVDPNHAPAHSGLAESYLGLKKFKEGYWELSETVRLDPDNVEARLAYATLSLAANRNEEVVEQAEAVVEIDPDNADGHLLLGQAYANLGRWDEVEAPLLRAVELAPDNGGYRAVIASAYEQLDRPQDAEKQLREGIANSDDPMPVLYTMLGRLLFEQERYDEAESAFEGALAAAQKQAAESGEGEEPRELAQAYQNLASIHFRLDEPDQAIATLEEGIEKSSNRADLVALLARYYRSTGDEEAAREVYESATRLDPGDPMPYLTVSNMLGRRGDVEGALEYAEKAIAAEPDHVAARLRKAELLIDMGVRREEPALIDEARTLIDQVLAEDATSPEGLFVLGKLEIARENLDAGVDALRAALDTRPDWPQAQMVLGSALMLRGEPQRARAALARAVELDPNFNEARRLLVKVHADLGEHEYAIENGRVYLRARPDDDTTRIIVAQSMVRLGKVEEATALLEQIPEERRTADALFAIGRLQFAQGQTDAARETMLKVDALRPYNARVLEVLLSIDRNQGKLSHAIKRVNDAVEARPDDAALWHLKGVVALYAGDPAGAEKALTRAIELEPNNLAAYQQLAGLYARTGRLDETTRLYERAVERQPDNAAAHHFLGVLYETTGQTAKAREQYELALRYDASLGESKNNLAYLLAEAGEDLDRALELAQDAKAAMPDSANAADTLGWVLYKRGVASAAVGYLREAVQFADKDDPAIGEIRSHLALAYEATGDVDKAIETLETALGDLERLKRDGRIGNDPPWAVEARARIEQLKSSG